ncbi:MAG: hypothetical protein ACTHLK_22690 [Brucella intermedia]
MTQQTMIERIAQVMAENAGDGRDYTGIARSVMEEMRDPTDLMGNGLNTLPGGYRAGSHSASDIWRVMIDAALEEKPE